MRQTMHVFAYLDAGTGSMILQVVLGGLAAVGVGGRVLWQRMRGGKSEVSEGESSNTAGAEASGSPESASGLDPD